MASATQREGKSWGDSVYCRINEMTRPSQRTREVGGYCSYKDVMFTNPLPHFVFACCLEAIQSSWIHLITLCVCVRARVWACLRANMSVRMWVWTWMCLWTCVLLYLRLWLGIFIDLCGRACELIGLWECDLCLWTCVLLFVRVWLRICIDVCGRAYIFVWGYWLLR